MAAHAYRRLAAFARVILVDRRGTGLSDPLPNVYGGGDFGPWLEEAVADIVSVLDAVGSRRTALVSDFYGATVAITLAATHPRRVSALVLIDPVVRLLESDDYPWGMPPEQRDEVADWYLRTWGEGLHIRSDGIGARSRTQPLVAARSGGASVGRALRTCRPAPRARGGNGSSTSARCCR